VCVLVPPARGALAVADTKPSHHSLGKQRYACYCVAQVLGAIFGALALKLALPPAMDETPFTTTGSLTFSHPFQVVTRPCLALRWASAACQRERGVKKCTFAQVFFLEFVCTFTLVYCVFATAVDKSGGEQRRVRMCHQSCARVRAACSSLLATGPCVRASCALQRALACM